MNLYPLLQILQNFDKQHHHKNNTNQTDNKHILQHLNDNQGNMSLSYVLNHVEQNNDLYLDLNASADNLLMSDSFYINLARFFIEKKHISLAETCFFYAIELNPSSIENYLYLAKFYHAIGNIHAAIEQYKKAILLNPKESKPFFSLAKIYLNHRHYQMAITLLKKGLKIAPQQEQAKRDLIYANHRLKYKQKLLEKSQPYVSMNKHYPEFHEKQLISAYIKLLKQCLTNTTHTSTNSPYYKLLSEGLIWPLNAETMIGIKRMDNLHYCVSQVLQNDIPGDLIEAGVWKGGACILMRGILMAYHNFNRKVWVADSFEGLPKPNEILYPQDEGCLYHSEKTLCISLQQVKANFHKYDLLDNQVKFLKGLFKDTLPTAPIKQLSILRLDGDMYESTMDALIHLYPKLSIGGFIIVDDYGALLPCRQAVQDYRKKHHISTPIQSIDHSGIFWKKEN